MRHDISALLDNSPVDIVYLWVDGQDPGWRAKRRHALRQLSADGNNAMEAIAKFGNVEGRFRDNDELLYSLRALEKFFPAHGHIYLVTDGQTPDWLKPSDRMTLVDHRQLIPEALLPTFDSSNIESYIHRIPGLSERYFYFNDDVFFGAPVHLDDWFWPGGFYVTWSDDPEVNDEGLQADATAPENACRLSNQWLAEKAAAQTQTLRVGDVKPRRAMDPLYKSNFRTFAHSPRPMLKSLLWELEEEAAELFDGVRSTVFRIWDKPTIVSDFVLRWALAHGLARVKNYRHRHVSTGDANQAAELKLLAAQFGKLDFFCINDTTDDAHGQDPRLENVRASLRKMLFKPSEFERHLQAEVSVEACPAALA
jgi:hypothetical protein